MRMFVFTTCMLACTRILLSPLVNGADQSEPDVIKLKDSVRGSRYGEILTVNGPLADFRATVYSTFGCNDCPEEQWKKIDPAKVQAQLKARKILLNGPRIFLMDQIGQFDKPADKVTLGGIDMVPRATLTLTIAMVLEGKNTPYQEKKIARTTLFVFNKGEEQYFLKNGDHTYIMQSFSMMKDPKLVEKDLSSLGSRLKLPPGWTFEVKILDKKLRLETKDQGVAYVIQDDLENTYQRVN